METVELEVLYRISPGKWAAEEEGKLSTMGLMIQKIIPLRNGANQTFQWTTSTNRGIGQVVNLIPTTITAETKRDTAGLILRIHEPLLFPRTMGKNTPNLLKVMNSNMEGNHLITGDRRMLTDNLRMDLMDAVSAGIK